MGSKSPDSASTAARSPVTQWCDRRTVIGLAWLLGFSVYFYSFDLPNNAPATRSAIWSIVPFQLLDVIWPLSDAQSPPSGWSYLPQRLPALLTAFAVVLAASGLGWLALSCLRITDDLPRLEQWYFAGAVGLALWSLGTLGLGLAGFLQPAPCWLLIVLGIVMAVWNLWRQPSQRIDPQPAMSRWLIGLMLVVCVPLLWAMLLGAITPQSDFDVLAYHLNGPKEWFLARQISFLPHNVYTSFPFLTEMLLLSGMVLLDDWSYGALAGQAVLWAFTPLTALGLFCAGRRWCSSSAGWLAVLVWLTTPWAYRISIIAYAEGGLAFYLLASFLAAQIALCNEARRNSWFLLTGFLAGSAMACKYPGLISVVVPGGIILLISLLHQQCSPRRIANLLLVYSAGVMLAVGPWLAKNFAETGNPVYPLAYTLFGGRDLDPVLHAKWAHGHAVKTYASLGDGIQDFLLRFQDVIADNDWHSGLLYGLAPLSLFWWRRTSVVLRAWLFLGWLFLTWFFLTHHIDRFWVPMIPIVALLAGIGSQTLDSTVGRWIGGGLIALAVAFNVTICSLPGISGFNAGLMNLSDAQRAAENALTPEIRWLNEEFAADRLPADFKTLVIGKATTFPAIFPVVYHSVFDRCLLEEWCAAQPGVSTTLKPAAEIRDIFRRQGVTHLLVDWRWIATYREPGNYGFTEFVAPDRIAALQQAGVLGSAIPLPERLAYSPLSDKQQAELQKWAPSLIVKHAGQPAFLGLQLFPVIQE